MALLLLVLYMNLVGEPMLSFFRPLSASCDAPGKFLENLALRLVQDDTSEQEKVGPVNN